MSHPSFIYFLHFYFPYPSARFSSDAKTAASRSLTISLITKETAALQCYLCKCKLWRKSLYLYDGKKALPASAHPDRRRSRPLHECREWKAAHDAPLCLCSVMCFVIFCDVFSNIDLSLYGSVCHWSWCLLVEILFAHSEVYEACNCWGYACCRCYES